MNKTNIEWCDYTWNPVTGCRRGCPYCYAKRMHDRFHPDREFSEVVFFPKRLEEKMPKEPATIFVGSMSDIEYWQPIWIDRILIVCRLNLQHTFMFLSKEPLSYDSNHLTFSWPKNTMQGLTLTCQQGFTLQIACHQLMMTYPRPFLSLEPLLGELTYNGRLESYEKIIVGAMTGPKAVKPKKEWIQSIKDNVSADKIFWKSNIKQYL